MLKFGWALLAMEMLAQTAMGVSIVGYNSAQFDRFSSGYSTSPVPNASPSFIGAGFDFSGVGWNAANPLQSFTLINDRYFMGAAHFMPSAGSTIKFFSTAQNAVVSYTVDSYTFRAAAVSPITGESGDLAIGRLTTTVNPADQLAAYPILNLQSFSPYVGLPLLVYGHGNGVSTNSPRIGTNTLDGFIAVDLNGNTVDDSLDYAYSSSVSPTGEAAIQSQDSGGPTFAAWYGQLALVGTHSATGTLGSTPYSFDNFAAFYLDQINAAGIDIEEVPEPSRALLMAVSLGSLILVRRRRL
jgi:hypothetical protein